MQPLLPLLTTLLPVLYGLSAAGYARVYIAEPGVFEGTRGQSGGPLLLRAAVFVHILYLAARGLMEGHLPIASVYDFLSANGFSLAVLISKSEYDALMQERDLREAREQRAARSGRS